MSEGWISLYRKFIEWEWYTDANTMRVFLHLLLKANHKDNYWQGQMIKRGQLITGRKSIAKELKISERSVRTSLNKLKSTNEITIKSTNKYSVVTIVKYDMYQDSQKISDQQNDQLSVQQVTSKRPANDQQTTTNNNDNNNNNIILFINKYKGAPKTFGECLKIGKAAREDSEWNNFTPEQQMIITNKLMEVIK